MNKDEQDNLVDRAAAIFLCVFFCPLLYCYYGSFSIAGRRLGRIAFMQDGSN